MLPSDWIVLLGATIGLGGLVALSDEMRRQGVGEEHTRRGVHAGVGLFVAATPFLFSSPIPVYLLSGVFVLVNGIAKSRHWWPGIHAARPESWGTVTMPMAAILGLAATWSVSPERMIVFQLAFLILAVADPVASWVGQRWGERTLLPGATLLGSGVFFVIAGVLSGVLLVAGTDWTLIRTASAVLLVAGTTTAVEMIGRRGWDNLFVILAVVLVLVPLQATPATIQPLFVGAAVGLGFGFAAYGTQTLTPSGAVGGGLFALSLVGLGGWAWAVPGFVFFGGASVLSRLDGGLDNTASASGPAGRRLMQVLANGGVAWALLAGTVLLPPEWFGLWTLCYSGFLGALAAAAADTWATEIGTRFARTPWSLRSWTRVAAGTSGAVSFVGTGAAALGAASVAGAALLSGGVHGGDVVRIVVAGVVGMGMDGVMGATLQARYRALGSEEIVEEQPRDGEPPVQGWACIDNDVVNLVGTTAGALAAMLL